MTAWYEVVPGDAQVSQGDLLVGCPILGGRADEDTDDLVEEHLEEDVLVVTQDCDLAQGKVEDVLLFDKKYQELMPRAGNIYSFNFSNYFDRKNEVQRFNIKNFNKLEKK